MSTLKELIFAEEARNKLLEGIDQLVDAICNTLGPKGSNVAIESSWGAPSITNQGNNVAKEIELKDQYMNMGISLAKESAAKMKETCGDGITTSLILLRAIAKNAAKQITSGSSPVHLKRGIEKALDAILTDLKTNAIIIQTQKEIQNIAISAASGDETIGALIAEAIEKVGKSGVITIEEGKGIHTTVEIAKGMQFERGYISSSFCTKEDTLCAELHNPRILVTDKKISSAQEILPILQSIVTSSSSLLIIAEDVETDALSTLVINKLKGILKVSAVKAPGFGDNRQEMLKDIAALTGAKFISKETGLSLKDANFEHLGSAEKVIVSKDKTMIIADENRNEEIKVRVKQIELEIAEVTCPYSKEKLEERRAKLTSGAAIIRVGGTIETEAKQKQQVFKDSLNSTRAAIDEGIVIGAGIGLLRASRNVQILLSDEENIGAQILIQACEAPLRQIIVNNGLDSAVIFNEILNKESQFGLNALTGKVENLLKSGIVDPLKVLRSALQCAVSTATLILFSEVLIGNAPEKE
ncbi:MAG TPA: chaperonin GroEL [Candidatus Rhabdochlamydia sp.]|jgi:chaperonin GroEL|nr:chaperonin GroEL [Candidatus Rhabdochlamydia sp.]